MASRHLSRIAALQTLFAADVRGDFSLQSLKLAWAANTDSLAHQDEDRAFTENLLKGVSAKQSEIDEVISRAAPQWPIEKIAIIDRNVLRLGLFELLYGSTISVPPKVALNEAIELAKMFGGAASSKFVNGVMGAVYRDMGAPERNASPKAALRDGGHAAGMVVCAKEKETWYVALVLDPFGKWTLPKSNLAGGELSQDAALRAVHEELGLDSVTFLKSVGEHTYTVHTPQEGAAQRTALYFSGCTDTKGVLATQKKEGVRDARWFSLEGLPENELYEDLRNLIELGLQIAEKECPYD